MKKLLALVCMITCVFGLTACGSETVYTDYEQQKIDSAIELATEKVMGMMLELTDEAEQAELENYTVEEIKYLIDSEYQLEVKNGFIVRSGIESFESALEDIGGVVEIGEATAKIDDDTIIVYVQVVGEVQDAEAEIIISNDMFQVVESAALNPQETMSDMMVKAALNTLIGMGTVFTVLILICGIIYCFALIPKIQAKFDKKDKEEKVETTGIDKAVAQIVVQEESTDDLELVAVIAAAIAAYEGQTSTDGFVVRSIRKVNKNRR